MRHTAASWLVINGVPLYDVQALLGHESYRTTERYAHLAPDAHEKGRSVLGEAPRRISDARAPEGAGVIRRLCWWAVLDLNQ